MMMGTPTSFEAPQTLEKVDLHQFDENATDSDDEALSDLEWKIDKKKIIIAVIV